MHFSAHLAISPCINASADINLIMASSTDRGTDSRAADSLDTDSGVLGAAAGAEHRALESHVRASRQRHLLQYLHLFGAPGREARDLFGAPCRGARDQASNRCLRR